MFRQHRATRLPGLLRRCLPLLLLSLLVLLGIGGTAKAAFVSAATYNFGRIISPRLIAVMWGPWTAAEKSLIDNYLKGLVAHMTRSTTATVPGTDPTVRQYGVWGAYYSGMSQGGMVVDPHPIPLAIDFPFSPAQVDEIAMDRELQSLQTAGLLPAGDGQTVFMMFTKGVRAVIGAHSPGTTPKEIGQGWCGYHDWTRGPDGGSFLPNGRVYALIPNDGSGIRTDGTGTNCNSTPTAIETATSHEVFEAATDPDGHGWGSVGDGAPMNPKGAGEVGDVCQSDPSPATMVTLPDGTTGWVANIIDNVGSTCSIYSTEQTPPISVVMTGTNTFNVFAQDANGIPRQISGDGVNWGSPQSRGGIISEAPTAISSDGRSIDVFGRGLNGGVNRWFFDGSNWSGPSGLGGVIIGPPSAVYRVSRGKIVYARGVDGVIYRLQDGNTNSWSWSALPMPTGILAISPPQVFAQTNDCDHIYFTGTNGHLFHAADCSDVPSSFADVGGVVLNRLGFAARPGNTGRSDIFIDGPVIAGGSSPFQKTFTNTVSGFNGLSGVVVGAPSAVALGTSAIRLFARGAGGLAGSGLFQNITNNGSAWTTWGQLDTLTITCAPLAFTPNNIAINLFLRRTDGGLVQKRFDGANWQSVQDLRLQIR